MRRSIAFATAVVLLLLPAGARAAGTQCLGVSGSIAQADELLRNRYTLSPHRTVTLPSNPSWHENPLHDANWSFQYHSLRFLESLRVAYLMTHDRKYRDRYIYLLRDWYRDNPLSHPASSFSWDPHATAWRAIVYACAYEVIGANRTWMRDALALHGRKLSSSSFYVHHGNHALNQNQGLLAVGCELRRGDWISRAEDRLNDLLPRSVNSQGVDNERSVFYEYYNYRNYVAVRERLSNCGRRAPSAFARVERMPRFMAAATRPDGRFETIGDTDLIDAPPLTGTEEEFPATRGMSGTKPGSTWRAFGAGYAFGRSGWGEHRQITDETYYSVRYGAGGLMYHGHDDGMSLTFYGFGAPLVLDPGKFTYNENRWRRYFRSQAAHNVVTASGAKPNVGSRTSLLGSSHGAAYDYYELSRQPYEGVSVTRRVLLVKDLGVLIVDDTARATATRSFRQLWHLRPDARPEVHGRMTVTRRARGNLAIRQLLGGATTRIVQGRTDPIQGWVSYVYGHKTRAPVVESGRRGTRARWITLLLAWPDVRPGIQVSAFRPTTYGFTATIKVGNRADRIRVSGASGSATPEALVAGA